jgi:putative hemin transport protein
MRRSYPHLDLFFYTFAPLCEEPIMSNIHTQHRYIDDMPALREAHREIQAAKPLRVRDAAELIGISEAELVAAYVGDTTTRLRPPNKQWINILVSLATVGRVMALTRNHAVVHERKGIYLNGSASGMMGLFVNDDIDLRLFFSNWTSGYAIVEPMSDGTAKRSLQFFDAAGDAVHKVFLLNDSNAAAFDELVATFRDENQSPGVRVCEASAEDDPRPDSAIDMAAFRADWEALEDTHHFFGLLKKYGLQRTQALRNAPTGLAVRVSDRAVHRLLELVAGRQAEIMCFVGNRGCIQIHTGHTQNIQVMGPWLNVMDAEFNLHLRTDAIAESWIVKKPTLDGVVTSLEIYDREGVQIVQFFGKRKPGKPERSDWREIIAELLSWSEAEVAIHQHTHGEVAV